MKSEWLIKKGGEEAILFFGGWGMSRNDVLLSSDKDVLLFYDYRDIASAEPPCLTNYRSLSLIAWSMGVWAASVLIKRWGIEVKRKVAINGTERPIDDIYGIPLKIYMLTERGMNREGRDKFTERMFDDKQELLRFKSHAVAERTAEELRDELIAIREYSSFETGELQWDRAYISKADKIISAKNQENWWRERNEIIYIEGGHYPFYRFENREII